MIARASVILILHVPSTTGFHIYYNGFDGGGVGLNQDDAIEKYVVPSGGSTEQCSLQCDAGWGCVLTANETSTCARCRKDEVSAHNAASCISCIFSDNSSWGIWSSYVKVELLPSDDQSRCEILDHAEIESNDGQAWYVVSKAIPSMWYIGGLGSVIGVYWFYWFVIAEKRLHRQLRKQKWSEAFASLTGMYERATTLKGVAEGHRVVASLACRQGHDGRSPLQIALDLGSKLGFTLVTNPGADEAPPGTLNRGLSPEERWRLATNFMLYPREDQNLHKISINLRTAQCCEGGFRWDVLVYATFGPAGLIAVVLQFLFYGSVTGARIDHGHLSGVSPSIAPKDLQECALFCTLFALGQAIGYGLLIFGPMIFFLLQTTAGKWVRIVARRANDADSASALLSLMFTFACTFMGMVIHGVTYFQGMGGGMTALVFSSGMAVAGAPLITATCIVKDPDRYATALKRMLQEDKKWYKKKTAVASMWPLMRASLLSSPDSSSSMWELFLPLSDGSDEIERATEVALELIKNSPDRDGALLVHTLMTAANAGVTSIVGCAKCIENILSFRPKARLLHATGEKHSPAELAISTVKSIEVKKAALVVLFDCIGVADLEDRIYESATCRVYRAEDLETGRIVAIKLFAFATHFDNETTVRDILGFEKHADMSNALVKDYTNLRRDHTAIKEERTRKYLNSEWKAELAESLFSVFKGGAIVMPLADYDLHHRLNFSRIAGIDATACIDIIRPIVRDLSVLHEHDTVHSDVKPRNIVFVDSSWKLIDLDAAKSIGSKIDAAGDDFKWTSGFASPELMRCWIAKGTLAAHPTMDTFSLGVLMYEMMTGQPLFLQDTCNNALVDPADHMRLCVWSGVSKAQLAKVFAAASPKNCTDQQRSDGCHVIRWCLQGDPGDRPTMKQLLEHRFLGGTIPPPDSTEMKTVPSAIDDRGATSIRPVIARNSSRARYHVFMCVSAISVSCASIL